MSDTQNVAKEPDEELAIRRKMTAYERMTSLLIHTHDLAARNNYKDFEELDKGIKAMMKTYVALQYGEGWSSWLDEERWNVFIDATRDLYTLISIYSTRGIID